ncbi:MAG: hypothetical protein WCE90_10875 [Candidatus Zixiibacteriota bacterium]
MTRKVVSVWFLVLISGFLFLGGAASSLSSSSREITGGIGFTRNNDQGITVRCWAEFEVKTVSDTSTKGWLKYHDADGLRFRMDVTCVNIVSDHDAIFSGPIVSTSDTSYVGKWLLIKVHDGGSPGSKGDTIGGEFLRYDPGCNNPPAGGPANVESGNLVVH